MTAMPDPRATERRNRIKIAVAAYAYEILGDPVMTDAQYDTLARLIHPEMITGRFDLDVFFGTKYTPDSGIWVHQHPEIGLLRRLALTLGPVIRRHNGIVT